MYPNLMNTFSRQKGVGLPAAIFILVVFALIVVALTNLEQRSAQSLGQSVQSNHAFWAAESGAQGGLSALFPPGGVPSNCSNPYFDVDYSIGATVPGIGSCSFHVDCTVKTDTTTDPDTHYYSLRSTGWCGSGIDRATRVIEVGATDTGP